MGFKAGMHPKKRELFALNVRCVDYDKERIMMNFLLDRVVLGRQVAGNKERQARMQSILLAMKKSIGP